MNAIYEAYRYETIGCQREDGEIIAVGGIDDCRYAIARKLGNLDGYEWVGVGTDRVAYRESHEEGCGGYAIRPQVS